MFKMGKRYVYDWVLKSLPKNYTDMIYIEPFCGSCSVLLNKDVSKEEYISDIDKSIINLHRTIRDNLSEFTKRLKKFTYSKKTFEKLLSCKDFDNNLDFAVNEFILRNLSKSGLKKTYYLQKNTDLSLISKRLSNVFIFDKNAFDLIKHFDSPETCYYLDPPHFNPGEDSTMTESEHSKLLDIVIALKGKVLITGYMSKPYNTLKNWNMKKFKKEILWTNY